MSAGRPCDYSGITWERIDAAGGVQWPCPADDPTVPARRHAPPLHRPARSTAPTGGPRCAPSSPSRSATRPRPEFPLLLNTGRTVEHWHTRTKTGRVPILEGLAPEAWVEVHPDDAAALGVRSGDWVRVASRAGRDRPDPGPGHRRSCGAGEVFIPFHWDERCANRLTDDEFDPISREPNYKQCAVQVEALPTRVGR